MRQRVQQLDAGVVFTDEGTLVQMLQATLMPTRIGASLLGACLVYFAGFSHLEAVHNAAHDTRHSAAFPCH
mgnify:CR=1 FL=1